MIAKNEGSRLYDAFVELVKTKLLNPTPTPTQPQRNANNPKQEDNEQTKNQSLKEEAQTTKEEVSPQSGHQIQVVRYGTYGNRQGLKLTTNGPFTHYFEF